MNTSPTATTILCFGDSNTYGQRPDIKGRWPANVRWTGQLQTLLGDDYAVIEEGLSSRTTDVDYADRAGLNGKTYLTPCLRSHNPLDIVVVMLGTNDLKIEFGRSAKQIGTAVGGLIDDIRQHAKTATGQPPRIIIMSPIHINDALPNYASLYPAHFNEQSARASKQIAPILKEVATSHDCEFLDAASVAHASQDAIHMDPPSHAALAQKLATIIKP